MFYLSLPVTPLGLFIFHPHFFAALAVIHPLGFIWYVLQSLLRRLGCFILSACLYVEARGSRVLHLLGCYLPSGPVGATFAMRMVTLACCLFWPQAAGTLDLMNAVCRQTSFPLALRPLVLKMAVGLPFFCGSP